MTLTLEQRRQKDDLKRQIREIEKLGFNPAKRPRHKRAKPTTEGQRDPRQVLKDHKGAIARLPCLATLIRCGLEIYGVQVAHQRFSHAASGVRNPGMQRKSHDFRVLPLCAAEHHLQHSMDERDYWFSLGMDEAEVTRLGRALFEVTEDHDAMLEVLRSAAQDARRVIHSPAGDDHA